MPKEMNKVRLGKVPLSLVGIDEYVSWIRDALREKEPRPLLMNCINAHLYNAAIKDSTLLQYLNHSDIVTADGMSIVWAARLFGYKIANRCNMTEVFRAFLQSPDMPVTKCILVGTSEQTAELAVKNINERSTHCRIDDWMSGYHDDQAYEDFFLHHADVDMVFLGMGSPKSERIGVLASRICPHAIIWHIGGGTILFFSGSLKEAPTWMRQSGIQWLHRLILEPRRMWRRYLIGNPLFIINISKAYFAHKKIIHAQNNQTKEEIVNEISLMGVKINVFTLFLLHRVIADIIQKKQKGIVANVNVNAMNIAWEQPWFCDFINASTYVFCDGHGVMLAAWLAGFKLPQKITYADWFPKFCEFCAEQGFSIYLLGGEDGVAEKAEENLILLYPELKIVGIQHGFFNKQQGSEESEDVITDINRCSPDVLLTSFGMPLQEHWLMENWSNIDTHIALTGGACLDYMSGKSKRPPQWLTRSGFEWLGRLIYEPRRLWKRYLIGNPLFFARLFAWLWRRKKPTEADR